MNITKADDSNDLERGNKVKEEDLNCISRTGMALHFTILSSPRTDTQASDCWRAASAWRRPLASRRASSWSMYIILSRKLLGSASDSTLWWREKLMDGVFAKIQFSVAIGVEWKVMYVLRLAAQYKRKGKKQVLNGWPDRSSDFSFTMMMFTSSCIPATTRLLAITSFLTIILPVTFKLFGPADDQIRTYTRIYLLNSLHVARLLGVSVEPTPALIDDQWFLAYLRSPSCANRKKEDCLPALEGIWWVLSPVLKNWVSSQFTSKAITCLVDNVAPDIRDTMTLRAGRPSCCGAAMINWLHRRALFYAASH